MFFRLIAIFSLAVASAFAAPPELAVRSYVLIEAQSGQVLAEKEADVALPPASITKLMTACLVFEALQDGRITLNDEVPVSQSAYAQKGSRMFIEVGSRVKVHDLLQGLIVQSGNDAGVALAEYVGGSVDGFVAMMNDAAKRLGMHESHFLDPVGLGGEGHVMSARDIATLSRHLAVNFPDYYHYYGQKSHTWNKITQENRNRLLFTNPRVDGLKTGHTSTAGYCLASTEKRGDLRLIAVVLGSAEEKTRYEASQALLDYGFSRFQEVTLLREDHLLKQVRVWKGESDHVAVRAAHSVRQWLPRDAPNTVRATVNVPVLVAPVAAGEKIGNIVLHQEGKTLATVDALAAHAVPEGGFFRRSWDGLQLIFED